MMTLKIDDIVRAATPDGEDNYPGFHGYTLERLQARLRGNNPGAVIPSEGAFRVALRAAVSAGRVSVHPHRHGNAKLYTAIDLEARARQLAQADELASLAQALGGTAVRDGVLFTFEQARKLRLVR